jgi:hypothetical protein
MRGHVKFIINQKKSFFIISFFVQKNFFDSRKSSRGGASMRGHVKVFFIFLEIFFHVEAHPCGAT